MTLDVGHASSGVEGGDGGGGDGGSTGGDDVDADADIIWGTLSIPGLAWRKQRYHLEPSLVLCNQSKVGSETLCHNGGSRGGGHIRRVGAVIDGGDQIRFHRHEDG